MNNKIDDDVLELVKVKELEYFAPFEPIQYQCKNLIYTDMFFCNLQQQQRLFLYMACCDDIEKDNKKRETRDKLITKAAERYVPHNNLKFSILETYIYKRYSTNFDCLEWHFTKQDRTKLNNRLKKIKTNIRKYEKNVEILDKQLLAEVEFMFEQYNNTENKQHNMFNKIFKFNDNTDLLNFQGCLGLLLMNEFCFYYNRKQISKSVLYAMLMTNLYKYSPFAKEYEREIRRELSERRQEAQKRSKTYSDNAKKKSEKNAHGRNLVLKRAHEIYMKNKKETENHIADLISNEILLNDNKAIYGIVAENPKSTIYNWLRKYLEWKDENYLKARQIK